jgi:hypothetical protein
MSLQFEGRGPSYSSDSPPLNLIVFIYKHKFEIFSLWILMFWILELQLNPIVMELGIGISLIDNSKKLKLKLLN